MDVRTGSPPVPAGLLPDALHSRSSRGSAARLEAAERILRDYARCWGRIDRVVYQVSLAGFKEIFPDIPDAEAKDWVAQAVLRTIAHHPALFWRDSLRMAKANARRQGG